MIMGKGHVDARDNTHVGWKRDLGLTLVAGLELPEVVFGGSSLELRVVQRRRRRRRDRNGKHGSDNDDGVRLSFCALDALRSWALLSHPPPPHPSEIRARPPRRRHGTAERTTGPDPTTAIAPPGRHGWDYTFTTRYPGATDALPLGTDLPHA